MRSLTACFVLFTASGCIHLMECTAHGGPTWHEVQSPHFEMKTNKSLEVATKDIALLKKLHFVMRWLFDIETDVDDPLTVISVTNSADLYPFGIDAAGLAVTSGPRRFLVLSGDSMSSKRGESAELYAHELAHLASRNAMPLQPHWLSEGFAEYAGPTLFLAAATAKVGLMPKRAIEVAGVASVEQLWAWSYDSMTDAQRGWFYFSAWAWVHYLFNNEAERFRGFIERTKEGGEVRQLFDHAFSAQWQAETKVKIDQYVRRARTTRPRCEYRRLSWTSKHASSLMPRCT